MLRIYYRLRSVPSFLRAFYLYLDNKNIEAEEMMETGEFFHKKANQKIPIEELLVKAAIKNNLEKFDESFALFESAYDRLISAKKIKPQDQKYLTFYTQCKVSNIGRYLERDVSRFSAVVMSDLEIGKVTKHLKKKFPCYEHPDFDGAGPAY